MTIIQKQCLLKYLGYYEGEIDGAWGALSEAATKKLQKAGGLEQDGIFGAKTEEIAKSAVFYGAVSDNTEAVPDSGEAEGDFWDTVQYFGRHEFACKCGKYCDGYPVEPSEKLLRVLDELRARAGSPVYVNSGIRCPRHNEAVGGADDSRHMYGDAADIRSTVLTPQQLYDIACDIVGNNGGVGLYDWGIHVDTRGYYARW